jgi:hypothetical protein
MVCCAWCVKLRITTVFSGSLLFSSVCWELYLAVLLDCHNKTISWLLLIDTSSMGGHAVAKWLRHCNTDIFTFTLSIDVVQTVNKIIP